MIFKTKCPECKVTSSQDVQFKIREVKSEPFTIRFLFFWYDTYVEIKNQLLCPNCKKWVTINVGCTRIK